MLYLAQYLHPNSQLQPYLKLLAQRQTSQIWRLLDPPEPLPLDEPLGLPTSQPEQDLLAEVEHELRLSSGVLLLVTLEGKEVKHWESATSWLLDLVQGYLRGGETPEFLSQEQNRLEAWRQQLTLEQQDLGRRLLEMEARLAKMQNLESDASDP